jgi:tryptophan-rich sensory protein
MMSVSWKIDRKAAWLLLPYLLWVSFAGILNFLMAF